MNRRHWLAGHAAWLGLLPPALSPAQPAPSSPPAPASALAPAALQQLHARIEAAIAARRLPGAVLWVERLGWPAHHAVLGQRAWEPAPEALALDAVYDVASLTKPVVTGTLLMQLLEAGRLTLEDPVARHLPAFAEGRPPKQAIRLRHLLTHCSGLPAIMPGEPAWQGAATGVALAMAAAPTEAPEQQFRYSDINFVLLGAVIERVGGAPLQQLARERIFEPLRMADSGYQPRQAAARLVPTAYENNTGDRLLRGEVHDPAARRMGGVAGHAGLFSTVADLARYARMVLGGGELEGARVLRADSVALMARNHAPANLPARGLSWDIASPYARPRGLVYPSGSSFGHTGFTGCALWIDPGSRSFYVFLSNRVHPRGNEALTALYEEVGTGAARAAGL